ncbi:universal stress protein, partial [Streptomyces longwoodensis]|uniref:universal stress protein n=1 Tax=Streptomyces longwoodensis TaxID=68231 RepID=UPI003F574DFC
MVSTVVAGLDGSPESRAAAEWAAREARLRGLPLKIVHVWEPLPEPLAQAHLAGEQAGAAHIPDPVGRSSAATRFRPVVVGIDIRDSADAVPAFACEEADSRGGARGGGRGGGWGGRPIMGAPGPPKGPRGWGGGGGGA